MGVFVEFVRVVATLINAGMFLSPIPGIREIYRSHSTGHTPFVPLAAMVTNGYIWATYGYLSENFVAIFGSCTFGVVISLSYVAIYYRWTTERAYARKVICLCSSIIVALTTYIILGVTGYTGQTNDQVTLTVGYVSIISSIIMYTSPFEKIRQVIKHRSAVFIPIEIVVVGSINSATWILFGFLISDWVVTIPNTILLMIGVAQITLYMVYHPSKHPLPDDLLHQATIDPKDPEASLAVRQSHRGDDKEEAAEASFVPLRSPLAPLHTM